MSDIAINILSALAVSVIITSMARVKSQRVKAILYTLPFPITIALIGSNSIATSLTVTGLMLTACFLWGCYYLHNRLGYKVLYADALLAILYVIVAYGLANSLKISFWTMLAIYSSIWIFLMFLFKNRTFKYTNEKGAKTNYWIKAMTVFAIAFLLFSVHQYLAAFVVTFPYNGVFAVYENRFGLLPQAALFTRNSIALALFFVANYMVGDQYPAIVRYLLSWLAFGLTLILVNSLIKLRVKSPGSTVAA